MEGVMWLNSSFWVTLLMMHGLAAFLLLGALTHQAISVWAPIHGHIDSFFDRARAVSGRNYGAAILVLYILTFVLGMIIYPDFKLTANNVLTSQGWVKGGVPFIVENGEGGRCHCEATQL
jgi:predicted membrane protein